MGTNGTLTRKHFNLTEDGELDIFGRKGKVLACDVNRDPEKDKWIINYHKGDSLHPIMVHPAERTSYQINVMLSWLFEENDPNKLMHTYFEIQLNPFAALVLFLEGRLTRPHFYIATEADDYILLHGCDTFSGFEFIWQPYEPRYYPLRVVNGGSTLGVDLRLVDIYGEPLFQ